MRQENIIGKRFNRLKVIQFIKSKPKNKWLCQCDCGNTAISTGYKLKSGHTKSCGCIRTEKFKSRVTKHGISASHPKIYHAYMDMMARCYNPDLKNFHRYGGRGIMVCEEWKTNLESFLNWSLQNGFEENLSLDRIQNDGNYEPNNCRWIPQLKQAQNRSTTVFIEHNGIKESMAATGRRYGITPQAIKFRLAKGWSVKDALESPKTGTFKNK